MVTIIVAAHGESAPALLKTASMILGNLDNVYPVTFLPGQGPEDLIEEYTRIVAETGSEDPYSRRPLRRQSLQCGRSIRGRTRKY